MHQRSIDMNYVAMEVPTPDLYPEGWLPKSVSWLTQPSYQEGIPVQERIPPRDAPTTSPTTRENLTNPIFTPLQGHPPHHEVGSSEGPHFDPSDFQLLGFIMVQAIQKDLMC